MPGPSKSPKLPEAEQAGCLSTIARIIWILVGNFALLVLVAMVAMRKGLSALDGVYWAVVAALLFIRYTDIKWLEGQGPDALPATMKDRGRYARLLLILGGGAWAAVHIVVLLLFR